MLPLLESATCAPVPQSPRDYVTPCYKGDCVPEFILSLLAVVRVFLRSRTDTALEILALRQQVAVLKRKRPRPALNSVDRLYLRRVGRRGDPGKRWLTFLRNHREVIVAFDFFTVPTVTFQMLYCFFVIEHGRRKILHFNVTRHPTADWVIQQLREVFPEAGTYRYVILDRDAKFDGEVITFLKATGLQPKRTSLQAPRQNGIAERWVGSCRGEILDHVIALNEVQLRRLLHNYVRYYRYAS